MAASATRGSATRTSTCGGPRATICSSATRPGSGAAPPPATFRRGLPEPPGARAADERGWRMKVAAIQHDIVWHDPVANFAHLAPMIEQAADDGARLVLLTEMYSTGFGIETAHIAEPPDGPSATFLHEQASR